MSISQLHEEHPAPAPTLLSKLRNAWEKNESKSEENVVGVHICFEVSMAIAVEEMTQESIESLALDHSVSVLRRGTSSDVYRKWTVPPELAISALVHEFQDAETVTDRLVVTSMSLDR